MTTDPFSMKSYELVELAKLYSGLIGAWKPHHLIEAHKFLFGFHTDVPTSFLLFGADLVNKGIFRLPFQFTVMEFMCGRGGDQENLASG